MAFSGHGGALFLFMLLLSCSVECRPNALNSFLEDESFINGKTSGTGERWAVLVAGSNGYENYRHQADICHAYQIMKKGGLKNENIIVFMYDDIAYNKYNPRKGIIINKPNDTDVYAGVPKDYTGDSCTAQNFYAVILGNKTALKGGSGKVLDTRPNDQIFIYYADHGSPGIIGMPSGDPVFAHDLIRVLSKKHKTGSYKNLVFYMEACESGSMFEGLLPQDINVYAVTAANAKEFSWAAYCPEEDIPSHPSEYNTCLGDLFSISWLEDSDRHDARKETLEKQYEVVKERTGKGIVEGSSHVMKYGQLGIGKDSVSTFIGSNSETEHHSSTDQYSSSPLTSRLVSQYDASLLHFWHQYHKATSGSQEKTEAQKKLVDEINQRKHVDYTMNEISRELFGHEKGSQMLTFIRSPGQPLVDNWDKFKTIVKTYEKHCGELSSYGKKYTRAIANMCNAGVNVDQMTMASTKVCDVKA